MHGRLSRVQHAGSGLFAGIPQDFSVVRYHSLAVSGSLGPEGRVTAWTDDGVVMGIEHRRRPMWGVQFHPESIATEHGRKLFENFYELARRAPRAARSARARRAVRARRRRRRRRSAAAAGARRVELRMRARSRASRPTEPLFERLFGEAEHAFWLDSADAPTRARPVAPTSARRAGAERCVLEYDVAAQAS